MRKILTFPSHGTATLGVVARSAHLVALSTTLAVTFCLASVASAQTMAQQLVPTAMGLTDNPVSQAVAQDYDLTAVDAAYSVLSDTTQVEPAGYRRVGRRGLEYCPPATNTCNAGCDVNYYINYEALWLRRENDERFSLTRNSFLPDFEYEFGGRYTIGTLSDCVNGWEASYVGPFDWRRQGTVTGAANVQSNLRPLNGYTASEVDTFFNADLQSQAYRAQLQSFEANRRWWVWDVVSTMIGVRYIDYEEDFLLYSENSTTGNGLFLEGVDNQMIGAQLGAEIIYPISLRGNVGVRGKAGVYGNFSERNTFMNNGGTVILNAGDSELDVAGLFEMGFYTNYHIVPSVRLTAGYEFWWMPGMATIPEQTPALISPASGTTVFNSDDLLLHGGHLGIQVLF